MIVELVPCKSPPGMDRAAVLENARHTIPRWREQGASAQALSARRRRQSGGFYVWPSREVAEKAHDAEWQAGAEKRTG